MRCNRCHRCMAGTTAYDGACACGGLIEATPAEKRSVIMDAQEFPDAPHTHPCPTCHQTRPCTGTGCADGPRECATCSNCRGW
jgi:hypothetical protein